MQVTVIKKRFFTIFVVGIVSVGSSSLTALAQTTAPTKVDFNRDIRPILSDTCFHCHGPEKANREAELRLDTERDAFKDLGEGIKIVTPHHPEKSALYLRISSNNDDERMPPADAERQLTKNQIEIIKRWIEQGADWQKHWSFISPKRPLLPKVKNKKWTRNPLDVFVLSRLVQEHLQPSPQARKETLIRRATLDLTGFPPTVEEVDAFLKDDSSDAFEKVIDRLLKSKRYGERMAMDWLDAARYADTSGYQNDGPRDMWRWRDWVINAFNDNKPFDQFTIEQIAGDMLPNATLDQKIATAFNRNHRGNAEGGIIPEEFQVEYVVDRVETTFTVWQGLTMGCGRCHEHKYDPISQKEFYQVYAYFNNIPESGRAIKEGNSPPYIKAPTPQQQAELSQLKTRLDDAINRFHNLQPALNSAQREWEKTFRSEETDDWSITEGLIVHHSFNGTLNNQIPQSKSDKESKSRFLNGKAAYETGKLGQAAHFDGKRHIEVGDVANFGYFDKFSFGAWVYPTDKQGGTILSRMTDIDKADGYSLVLKNGKVQVNLVKRWLDDCIRVETCTTIPLNQWTHVFATYDGSRVAKGITIYFNGKPAKLNVHLDGINQSFASATEPLRIGGGNGPNGRFHGRIDDIRIYNRHLSEKESRIVSVPDTLTEIITTPTIKRNRSQKDKLRDYFLHTHAPKQVRTAHRQLMALRKKKADLLESLPTVMIMQEMEQRKPTHLLKRGEYDKPAEVVSPAVPSNLAPLPKGVPNNRLGFARWLVDRNNSLTARVTVNRFWQMLFGIGIVKTAEDFGSQGEQPSHPELLDWLAVEFMDSGWDVKHLLKTIMMSATYQQSSRVSPQLVQRDPENRLLARGARYRLPAELIRDQSLLVSGLLTEQIGGPSVKPYQPAGLWKEIATTTDYVQDKGPNLYRRSMYTYWKRTVAPPTMMNFDAGAREYCTVRRPRTNTPLQALTLMNDVTFVEAARVLAERVMKEGGEDSQRRITYLFRLATSRKPREAEQRILNNAFKHYLKEFRNNSIAADKLVSSGDSPRDKKLNITEHATYTALCSLILNLDEVVTRE